MVIEKAKAHKRNVLEYKDHQASHGEQTVHLPTIIHCYLLTHCLKDGPVATVIMANVVANVASLMNGATVPMYGKTCDRCKGINHFKAVCHSKVTAKTVQSPH